MKFESILILVLLVGFVSADWSYREQAESLSSSTEGFELMFDLNWSSAMDLRSKEVIIAYPKGDSVSFLWQVKDTDGMRNLTVNVPECLSYDSRLLVLGVETSEYSLIWKCRMTSRLWNVVGFGQGIVVYEEGLWASSGTQAVDVSIPASSTSASESVLLSSDTSNPDVIVNYVSEQKQEQFHFPTVGELLRSIGLNEV